MIVGIGCDVVEQKRVTEALEKYDEAVEIVRYVIRQLEEGRVEERMGVNRLKLQEHRTMLYEMERHVWSENHRFGE